MYGRGDYAIAHLSRGNFFKSLEISASTSNHTLQLAAEKSISPTTKKKRWSCTIHLKEIYIVVMVISHWQGIANFVQSGCKPQKVSRNYEKYRYRAKNHKNVAVPRYRYNFEKVPSVTVQKVSRYCPYVIMANLYCIYKIVISLIFLSIFTIPSCFFCTVEAVSN